MKYNQNDRGKGLAFFFFFNIIEIIYKKVYNNVNEYIMKVII